MSAPTLLFAFPLVFSAGLAGVELVQWRGKGRSWAPSVEAYLVGLTAAWAVGTYLVFLGAFLTCQTGFEEVWKYTHPSLSVARRLTSSWAGQEGSLLVWWVGLVVGLVLECRHARTARGIAREYGNHPNDPPSGTTRQHHVTLLVQALVIVAFTGLVLVLDPFDPTPAVNRAALPDGQGLLLELQSAWMVIHPPVILAAFASTVLLFARSVGAFVTTTLAGGEGSAHPPADPGSASGRTLAMTRVVTWTLLTAGIGLGAIWAYATFGWGGFWAWDPIETSALLPWLVLTGAIHDLAPRGNYSRCEDPPRARFESRGAGPGALLLGGFFPLVGVLFCAFVARSGALFSRHAFSQRVLFEFFVASLVVSGGLVVAGLAWQARVSRGKAEVSETGARGREGREGRKGQESREGQEGRENPEYGHPSRLISSFPYYLLAGACLLVMPLAPHHLAPGFYEVRLLPFIGLIGASFLACAARQFSRRTQWGVSAVAVALVVGGIVTGGLAWADGEPMYGTASGIILLTRPQVGWAGFLVSAWTVVVLAGGKLAHFKHARRGRHARGVQHPRRGQSRSHIPQPKPWPVTAVLLHVGLVVLLAGYFPSTFLTRVGSARLQPGGSTAWAPFPGVAYNLTYTGVHVTNASGIERVTRVGLALGLPGGDARHGAIALTEDMLMGDVSWGVWVVPQGFLAGDVYLTVSHVDPDGNGRVDELTFEFRTNPGVWLVWTGGAMAIIGGIGSSWRLGRRREGLNANRRSSTREERHPRSPAPGNE